MTTARVDLMPAAVLAESAAFLPRDLHTALSMIECASKALEILYNQRDELETSLQNLSVRAEHRVAAAEAKVLDWQRHAADAKSEVRDLDRQLGAMQQRAQLAEEQLESERSRAEAADRQARDSLALVEAFRSKILASFGSGSRAHKSLLATADDFERTF